MKSSNVCKGLRAGLKVFLLAFLIPTLGQAAELLRPVDQNVVDSFTSPEKLPVQYGLRRHLYLARKYRIVEVDFDLLNQANADFTITPWEGLVMKVRTVETASPGSYAGLQHWTGRLTNGGVIPFVNLTVRDLDQMMPAKLVRRIQAETSRNPLPVKALEGEQLADNTMIKMRFRTLMGTVSPELGKYITIAPIDEDPRYHVVFEEDSSKRAMGGGVVAPEEAEKARKMGEFYKEIYEEQVRDLGR